MKTPVSKLGNPAAVVYCLIGLFMLTPRLACAETRLVDTGQSRCYDDAKAIPCPAPGQPFFGQDAQFAGAGPAYRDNGDGTITDLNTGLMWSKGVDARKLSLDEAERSASRLGLGGHHDWRLPNIKELYSLIDFRGYTGSPERDGDSKIPTDAVPFIDTDFFDFAYGDIDSGERYIDAQWLSATKYVSTTMDGMETLFGVNFADGRIKGYGFRKLGTKRWMKTFFVRYVRGAPYGENEFIDNGDGTISDRSTGLVWMKGDSEKGMNWQQALSYAEKLELAGHSDWRLPDAKELQSIVDYSRSPDASRSPAIVPLFEATAISNEAGQRDYPCYWTSTTHQDGPNRAANAVYIAFGRAIGQLHGRTMDVHGAGAQRSDPKRGQPALGHGPQGDARRVYNYVRCVRGGKSLTNPNPASATGSYPNRIRVITLKVENSRGGHPGGSNLQLSPVGYGNRPEPAHDGTAFVRHLDRDGDGKVSRSEFDGPPDRFDLHDRNRDGYLSAEEAPQGPPPTRQQ